MRTVVSSAGAAIFLVTLATRAVAQGCPDVTGCWQGSFSGAFLGTVDLNFEQTGNQLSGLVGFGIGGGIGTSGLSGTAMCDALDFTFSTSGGSASFSGHVTGDCMAGTFSLVGPTDTGTWQACRVSCGCGNGVIQPGEVCDDGNMVSGDGCSETCMFEPGFECSGEPTVCVAIVCGNGLIASSETCDDGNTTAGDGCSDTCAVEAGFTCFGQPSVCLPIVCGNAFVQPGEACDDGNTVDDDCCHNDCTPAPPGTACTPAGTCDGNGHCGGFVIPTLSEWGVIVLSLLMLAAVLYGRQWRMAVGRR